MSKEHQPSFPPATRTYQEYLLDDLASMYSALKAGWEYLKDPLLTLNKAKINLSLLPLILTSSLPTYVDVWPKPPLIQEQKSQISINQLLEDWSKSIRGSNKWWHLPGTGFNIETQIKHYYKDLSTPNSSPEYAFNAMKQDITHLAKEYFYKRSALSFKLQMQQIDGKQRLVGTDYSKEPLVDMIDKNERAGALYESNLALEAFLQDAKPGSVAILTSPPGYSGLKTLEGKQIKYKDSQTWIVIVQADGSLESLTLVTDMNVDQNITFLKSLGVSNNKLQGNSDPETEANIVRSPIFLEPGSQFVSFEDVLQKIHLAMAENPIARTIKAKGGETITVSFEELLQQIKDRDNETIDPQIQLALDDLKQKVTKNPRFKTPHSIADLEELSKITARTVLDIREIIMNQRNGGAIPPFTQTESNYQQQADLFQSDYGCNGGDEGSFSTPWGTRSVEFSGQDCPEIKCGGCSWKPNTEELEKIKKGQIRSCIKCGWKP